MEETWRKDRSEKSLSKYLLIHKSGYVELGRNLAGCYRGSVIFRLTPMIAEVWQFISFVQDLYQFHGANVPFRVTLNMIQTRDSQLSHLGQGWLDPFSQGRPFEARTEHRHIRLPVENLTVDTPAAEVESRIREVAALIDNAYGVWETRVFNHPDHGDPAQFNPRFIRDPWS